MMRKPLRRRKSRAAAVPSPVVSPMIDEPVREPQCPVCASPLRRVIELRLMRGSTGIAALSGLDGMEITPEAVERHFEAGHIEADARLLVAGLIDMMRELQRLGANGKSGRKKGDSRGAGSRERLMLDAMRLIAEIAPEIRSASAQPQLLSQTINMLLSDEQAAAMRTIAGRRTARH